MCGHVYLYESTCPGDMVRGRQVKLRIGQISIAPMLVCGDVYANVSIGPGDRATG